MNLRILKKEAVPETGDLSRVLFLLPSENEPTAEDLAMLQALYSRDPRPIDAAVKLLKTSKSGDFMNKFYVGYGHESIAELGDVVIAVENVPMPVAKLIQHYQLYKGQECSTRYIDFSNQPFIARTDAGKAYQEKLRSFYLKALEPTTEHLIARFGIDRDNANEMRGAKAAAFDVLRGFLPNGAVTNLAWKTDLRYLNNRLHALSDHIEDFPELKVVIDKIRALAMKAFPNSIREERNVNTDPLEWPFGGDMAEFWMSDVKYIPLRPVNGEQRGIIEWTDTIDFASWRDLARHRSVYQTFPVIGTDYGFEWWYHDQLPPSLQEEAEALVEEGRAIKDDVYAIPMGFKVPFVVSGPLEKFRYIIRLRSGLTVHPTLREAIYSLAGRLTAQYGLTFSRLNSLAWVVGGKRGTQDIVQKEEQPRNPVLLQENE
jgi:thymidylate synthase ThyX